MKESSKNRLFGICGTVIFHVTLILILFLVTFSQPSIPDDGEGILVQVGLVSESQGTLDSSSDIQSQEKNSPEETIDDNEIISQETEETIQITPPEEKKKDFRLEYVPYKELKDILEENRENAKAEKREFIIDEMLAVLKVYEKEVDRNNRQEETR